ncbi:hypothetical protein JCM10212_004995 [Sporobolomyces blumeae]
MSDHDDRKHLDASTSAEPSELLSDASQAPARRSSTTSSATTAKEDVLATPGPSTKEASTPASPAVRSDGIDMTYILTGKKLAVVFTAMLLSMLLVALDQTILATALPRIASDFNSFDKQGWVSSAFIMTQSACILMFGPFLRIYPAKWCLLSSIVVFEVGSAVCGGAHNVDTLIVGRAVSGVGAAGIFVSILSIIAQVTLLEKRPALFGLFGLVFGAASIAGPLIGGALTDHATWRWCFLINIPVGAVSCLGVIFLLKAAPPLGCDPNKRTTRDLLAQTLRIDWIGGLLVLGSIVSLVLALQWGGNQKPWNDGAVIACFVVAGVAVIVLVFWQRHLQDRALVPPAIFKSVSVYAIAVNCFVQRCSMLLLIYYIPIYYQAAKNHSATKSGIDILALMLSMIFSVVLSGRLVQRFGRYWPFLALGPIPGAIGGGLLYTISPTTSNAKVIGYQILCGVGLGTTLQNGLFAMQSEFRATPKLVAQSTGVASFSQFLGGTIALAIGQASLSTELTKNFAKFAPDAPLQVIKESPLKIWDLAPDVRQGAIQAYVKSLDMTFVITVAFFGVSLLSAMFIKNLDIRPPKKAASKDAETGAGSTPVADKDEKREAELENKAKAEIDGETARAEGA